MTGLIWMAGVATSLAVVLAVPGSPRLVVPVGQPSLPKRGRRDWLRRWRPLWMVLAGAAAAMFIGGLAGLLAAPAAAVGTWLMIERSEPAALRHDRAVARRDLPHVVGLLADALRSGQSPTDALAVVVTALPGPATARLAEVVPRLRLGLDPMTVWGEVAADPALGRLGSAMARAHRTGAPVVPAVERLASELSRTAHAEVEDRARAVGVKAALPLGLCLLPAFVLIGIVPVVAGLLTSLDL